MIENYIQLKTIWKAACRLAKYIAISLYYSGGSVIPAAVKTPGNKLVRIIMPGINMVAVKKPEKKFAQNRL